MKTIFQGVLLFSLLGSFASAQQAEAIGSYQGEKSKIKASLISRVVSPASEYGVVTVKEVLRLDRAVRVDLGLSTHIDNQSTRESIYSLKIGELCRDLGFTNSSYARFSDVNKKSLGQRISQTQDLVVSSEIECVRLFVNNRMVVPVKTGEILSSEMLGGSAIRSEQTKNPVRAGIK